MRPACRRIFQDGRLLIGGQPSSFSIITGGQIAAAVPASLGTGAATVQLISPTGAYIPTVLMQVDPPPPVITAANPSGASSPAASLKSSTAVTLTVSGLANANVYPLPANVQVTLGGVEATALSVTPVASQPGVCVVQFTLPANLPNGQIPVTIGNGTRVSPVYFINIQN